MEDIDKLQTHIEHIDALIFPLLPFFAGNKQYLLLHMHRTLEPLKHIKEIMHTFDMVRNIQKAMETTEAGGIDLSKLSSFLSPEQLQMFEIFQTMQEINL